MVTEIVENFRHGVEQLAPFETPDVMPIVELIESLNRLSKQLGEIGYAEEYGTGIRQSGCISWVANDLWYLCCLSEQLRGR